MAEGQPLQHALIEMGTNALFRQPAEADLIHHRINGGVNGGESPGVTRRLAIAGLVGNAHQRPWCQRAILQRTVEGGERMVAVGDGDKINIHQPLSAAGNILAAGQNHDIGFRSRRALVIHIFQHFGESDLRLRIALLKLAQNGEQPLARENAVDHQIQTGARPVAQSGGMRLNVGEGL